MIPAWIIALLSLTTALGLLREAYKKTQPHYKARWACMSLPFFYQTCIYTWVEIFQPVAEMRGPFIRTGYFTIIMCATFYFFLDLIDDIKSHRSK